MDGNTIINIANCFVDYIKMLRNIRHPRIRYKGSNGKSVIVLGNGPSAKSLESAHDNSVDIICVNDFASSPLFEVYKPNAYLIWDPAYWTPTEKTNAADYENRIKTLDSLVDKTTWDLDFYCPIEAVKSGTIQCLSNNPKIRIIPINRCELSLTDAPYYYKALEKNSGSPSVNVVAIGVWLSINLGYSTIYLLGAENSWSKDIVVNDNNEVCTIREHFYGEKVFEVWRKSDTSLYHLHEILSDLSKLFLNYQLLSKYAKMKSVRVYNCTPGSFIDAFARRSIDEIKQA